MPTILDLRTPGQRQRQFGLKLPEPVLAQLQSHALQLGTSRAALTRALVLEGLQRLQGSEVAK